MNLDVLTQGLGASELALATLRVATGAFFACSGFNKLTNRARHAAMRDTLVADKVPAIRFNEWWVPSWELLGGACLALGIAPAFCAAVLAVICVVAACCEGAKRVKDYQPINSADCLADWLYLPEVLYVIMLGVIVLSGGGAYKLFD